MQDASPPARKATLSSRICADLRAAILRGDLAPAEKINLDRLRETYQISISPLREAVSRLIAEGLVNFEDQRGYSVTPVSLADLAEVTRLRGELETIALGEAVNNGDLEWESAVMGALYRLSRTAKDTPEAWEEAHSAFHMALVSGCGAPRLLQICAMLRTLQDRYRRLWPPSPQDGAARQIAEEHRAIAEAATSREAARAAALLRAHIEATGTELRARMQTHPPATP